MKKWIALVAVVLLVFAGVMGAALYEEIRKANSDDPLVWEEDIAAFEAADLDRPPPPDTTLFVGSSSIRLWKTLAEDMAPLVTLRRGFGGARMHDVVHYADRLITAYHPAQVVIFVGSNDISLSDEPMKAIPVIREGLGSLIETIRALRPDTEIFYLAITPTILAWEKRDTVRAANAEAERICAEHARVHFIPTEDLFLTTDGEPDPNLYRFDGLHLSDAGYERWTQRIKPLLVTHAPD